MPALRPQPSIPVLLLVKSAYQILWQQRDDALRLGFIPTLVCFGGLLYGRGALTVVLQHWRAGMTSPPPDGVALPVFATLMIVLLAIALAIGNWLRFMLLGPMGAVGLGLAIGRPHVSFLISTVLLVFGASIAFAVLSMPALLLPGVMGHIGIIVVLIAVTVVTVRLSPFVIGQVIAQPCARQQVSVQGRTVNHRERALPLARGNSFICENKVICGLPFLGRHRGCRAFWMKTKGNLDDATKS